MLGRLIAIALIAVACAGPALAQDGRWWRAESANFIVYGDRGPEQMQEVARLLEDFDTTLRRLTNVTEPPAPNKLKVYVVRDTATMRQVWPGVPREVRGFYRAGTEEIAAFVIYNDQWGLRRNQVLFHEYAHHFMLHYFPHAYPRWYVEGWAEYVSTTEISGRSASVGIPSIARGNSVANDGLMQIEHMLAPERLSGLRAAEVQAMFYGQAWFATTTVIHNPERMRGLNRYVQALGEGGDPIDSFEPSFGISPEQFERELREARRGRIPRMAVSLPNAQPTVEVRQMSPVADRLLLRLSRARSGSVSTENAAELADDLERYAAPYPDEPFAQIAMARASMLRADYRTALQRLTAVLEADEAHVEARYMLALSILMEAREQSGMVASDTVAEARRQMVRAFRTDPNHAPTLYLYASSFAGGPEPMRAEHLDVLARALELAPQTSHIRLMLARELMEAEQYPAAIATLRPLLYAGHNSSASEEARALFAAARENRQPPAATQAEESADTSEE